MKSLNQYITEKLKVYRKNPNVKHFNPEEFKLICMYILAYLKDDDLYIELKENSYFNWGEIERYREFGIDFTNHQWMFNIANNFEGQENNLAINMFDLAEAIGNLYTEYILIYKDKKIAFRYTLLVVIYLISYVENTELLDELESSSEIDWDIIKDTKIYNRRFSFYDDDKFKNSLTKVDKELKSVAEAAANLMLC